MADAKATFLLEVAGKAAEDLKLVNKKLEEMEQNAKALEKMRQGALLMGGAMAVGLGLAVAQAVKFESALAPVKSVLTGTAAEVQAASARIGKEAMEWSSRYSQSSEEFLGASYNMLSAGLNEVQAIAGTRQALALATATMGDASTASQLMGTLYNNFADKTRNATAEMTMLSDVVTKTQQAFQIANLGQLNEGLKYAAASAQAFKVSFMQTSAVVGQLNTLGLSGSMAGTAFNAMMSKLNEGAGQLGYSVAKTSDGGIDLVKTLENVKKVGADADTLNKVFGQEGAKGVILLTEKIGDLQKNYELVKNSAGATAAAQAEFEKTFANQSKVLGNNMNNLGVTLGNVLLPALASVLRVVNPIVRWFQRLLEEHKLLAMTITVVTTVLAFALTLFGSWIFLTKTAVIVQGLFSAATLKGAAAQAALGAKAIWTGAVSLAASIKMMTGQIAAGIAGTTAGAATAGAWVLASVAMAAATLGISALIAGIVYLFTHINNIRASWDTFKGSIMGMNPIIDWLVKLLDWALWKIQQLVDWFKKLFNLSSDTKEMPSIDIAQGQQQVAESLPAQKAMPASKVKMPKGNTSGGETDWGMNSEFLAANGLGGSPVKASAKTIDTARAGMQSVTHSKGGAVDKSRSIHIANITIDGANIRDWDTFKMELSAAVGGMA